MKNKMRILIIGFSKLKYMPYLQPYLLKYANENNYIDIIYWNRDGKDDISLDYNIHAFFEYNDILKTENKFKKLFLFYKFRRFCLKKLKTNKYDLIITLHTFPAFLLRKYLIKNYFNRYIFDFRDLTYERFAFFKNRIGELIINSKYTFVSSAGYLKYLPNSEKIYITHNIFLEDLKHREKKIWKSHDTIHISFWGLIRAVEINEKLMSSLFNSNRFILNYYGPNTDDAILMKEFARYKGYDDVFFNGEYINIDRYSFKQTTDLLHNIYSNKNFNTQLAMGNKFYDGIIFYIPQICCKDTLMGELVEAHNVGIAIDLDDELAYKKILDYYDNLDYDEFCDNCDNYLKIILDEYWKVQNLK